MKTATVRDLRNHFADVAKWIEGGEEIIITRNGKNFATLTPAISAPTAGLFQTAWARRNEKYAPVGKKLSASETENFWSQLRD